MAKIALKQIEGLDSVLQAAQALEGVDLSALEKPSMEVRLNLVGDLVASTGTAKWSPFSQITILYAYFTFAKVSSTQAQARLNKNTTPLCTLTAASNAYKSDAFTAVEGAVLIANTDFLTVDLLSVQGATNLTLTIGYKKWQ